jgi:hypothetical protein
MPHAQCPMPYAQCPIPHSPFPIPHSLFTYNSGLNFVSAWGEIALVIQTVKM